MKIVSLMTDDSPENPAEFDGAWSIYSFNRRHRSFKDPGEFFNDAGKPSSPGLRRKFEVGLAFVLSYSEHGTCQWTRAGRGYSDPWDTVRYAGILIWEHPAKEMGAKSLEDRAKDADQFLETYTAWCNGEVYGYSVDDRVTLPCGHSEDRPIDSSFGYFGNDLAYMASLIRDAIAGDPEVTFRGDAAFLSDTIEREIEALNHKASGEGAHQ